MDIQYINSNEEHFRYLFELQESGRTNMFGAAIYLQNEQGLNKQEAKDILIYWMENYEAIAKHLAIEV